MAVRDANIRALAAKIAADNRSGSRSKRQTSPCSHNWESGEFATEDMIESPPHA